MLANDDGWQLMETAPKVEGQYLLAYDVETALAHGNPSAGLCVICWVEADEGDEWPAEWQVQPFSEGLDFITSDVKLTHWRFLPSPPASEDEA